MPETFNPWRGPRITRIMHGQPSIFRFVRLLLQPFGLDTATTGFRCWTSTGAPWATATRLHDGFALALGRREVVVSRR